MPHIMLLITMLIYIIIIVAYFYYYLCKMGIVGNVVTRFSRRMQDVGPFCTDSYIMLLDVIQSVCKQLDEVYKTLSVSSDSWLFLEESYKKSRKKLNKVLCKLQFISSCVKAMDSLFDGNLDRTQYDNLLSATSKLLKSIDKQIDRIKSVIKAEVRTEKQYDKIRKDMELITACSYSVLHSMRLLKVQVGQSFIYDKIVKDIELEFKYLYK